MHTKRTSNFTGAVDSVAGVEQVKSNKVDPSDTQVKPTKAKVIRRKFSHSEKLKMLAEFDACHDVLERNALLRRHGLYSASITKWRRQFSDKKLTVEASKANKWMAAHNKLMHENAALKKQLAQAEAIIDIQKKVSELLSISSLNQEMSEVK